LNGAFKLSSFSAGMLDPLEVLS